MKEKYNLKSIVAGLICLIIGIILILLDIFSFKTPQNLWISIGCSLIASGVVILLTALFVERVKVNPLEEWKIEKIYKTRAEKNLDSDPKLEKARYCIDGVAFGLKSFRTQQSKRVEKCLKKGVMIRILTMNPASEFLQFREKEEASAPGEIKMSIEELIKWANKLNKKNYTGKIIIKGYNCMTLDFYWRVDNELYIGPYWYGYDSQQTITYKFIDGGKGFDLYADYFEKIWENDEITETLTVLKTFSAKKK